MMTELEFVRGETRESALLVHGCLRLVAESQ
jgi:hypothetical protein